MIELAISAVLILLVIALIWKPDGHDVRTPGAVAVSGAHLLNDLIPTYVFANVRPSMSLADVRCQAWLAARKGACPDAATISLALWPDLKQSPNTLYVGLSPGCVVYDPVYGLNVEYLAVSHRLTIHCYSTSAWIAPPVRSCGNCPPGPVTIILLVPTNAIEPGPLTVIRDDRVEHLLGDDSTEVALGTLTVS
jgi:hypothetical protein